MNNAFEAFNACASEAPRHSVTLSTEALGRWLTRRCNPPTEDSEFGGFRRAHYTAPHPTEPPEGYCVLKQARWDARSAYCLHSGCDTVEGLWLGEARFGPLLTNYYLCPLEDIPEIFHFVSLSGETRVEISRHSDGTFTVEGQMSERTVAHLQKEIESPAHRGPQPHR